MSVGTREQREPRRSPRPTATIPPAWVGATLVLALLALLPTAVAIGRWGWTPTTGSLAFVVLVAVVVVETWVSSAHREGLDQSEGRRHRVLEALVLGLLAAAAAWIGDPLEALRPDRLLGPDLLVAALVTFGAWVAVSQTHRDLAVLVARGRVETGQSDPLERLARRALLLGLVAGLAVFLGDVPLGPAAVVAYAAGASAALARVRFADLERRWTSERARVGDEVRTRFRSLAGGLIVAVTLLAIALPAPVEGGARVSRAALRAITGWLQQRFDWLFGDFLELQEPEADQEVTDATEDLEEIWGTPEPAGAPIDLPEPPAWADAFWSTFAWVAGGLVILTIVVLYLRERPHVRRALGLSALGRSLRRPGRLVRAIGRFVVGLAEGALVLLGWLVDGLRRAARRATGAAHEDEASRARPTGAGAGRAVARTAAVTRERARVLDAYHRVVETAAERGRGRSAEQTPYEYERRLAPAVAARDAELRRLTEAFIVARYSTSPVAGEEADVAVEAARLVREALATVEEQA